MQFYTNVSQWGNTILVREYKKGERVNRKVKYSPTLYIPVQKKTDTKHLMVSMQHHISLIISKMQKGLLNNTNNNLILSLV